MKSKQSELHHSDAWMWPTLDELRSMTASETENTIRQIITGQIAFCGYEYESSGPETTFKPDRFITKNRRAISLIARFRKVSFGEAEVILRKLKS